MQYTFHHHLFASVWLKVSFSFMVEKCPKSGPYTDAEYQTESDDDMRHGDLASDFRLFTDPSFLPSNQTNSLERETCII